MNPGLLDCEHLPPPRNYGSAFEGNLHRVIAIRKRVQSAEDLVQHDGQAVHVHRDTELVFRVQEFRGDVFRGPVHRRVGGQRLNRLSGRIDLQSAVKMQKITSFVAP